MSSIYPNGIDGYGQLPLVVDKVTEVKAETVNRIRTALVAVETELGVLPSGTFSDVTERLDSVDISITALDSHAASIGNPHNTSFGDLANATLAQVNAKITDATLIDTTDSRLSDARTPTAHSLAGAEHSTDTLANLNSKIIDATLIDTTDSRLSDARTPTAHRDSHITGGSDAFLSSDVLEAVVKRVQTTDGPTNLDFGSILDGYIIQRSGSNLIGRLPSEASGVVRLATTGNHGLTGLANIDGVTPLEGDRVLVWQNTAGAENGPYIASSGAWSRAPDFDDVSVDNIQAGRSFYVQEGDSNNKTTITLVTAGTIILNTTSLEFIQGGPLVRSDATETSVKPSGPGAFNATETNAAAQMTAIDVRDFKFVSVYVDITTQGSITTLNVKGRLTGKSSPDKDVEADWAPILADNLDKATGISTVQDYQIQVTVGSTGRFGPFRFPCDAGSQFSARVWVNDGTSSVGDVYVYRSV